MSGIGGSARTPSAILSDKREFIHRELSRSLPTIVISNPDGIYVFAQNLGKVHSTILLSGVGQDFTYVETWFREQISNLVHLWGPSVPKARKEFKLLPMALRPNVEPTYTMMYADFVLVEVGDEPEDDSICRIDYLRNVTWFKGGEPVVISYKVSLPEERHDSDDEEDEGEEEEEDEKEARTKTRKDLAQVGVESVEMLNDPEVVEMLRESYPGDKGFLDREVLRERRYSWVYRSL